MAAEKEEWKIPQLTAENHDTWFRRNKVKLKGKKVFYVCEKNLVQHCQIATASRLTEAMEELEIAETDKHTKIRITSKEFKTTIDTLNAQLNLTVEQKLKFLEEKEVRDQQDANEKALPAFRKTEKYVPPYRRRNHKNSPLSSDSNLVPNSRSNASFVMEPMAYETAQDERARKLLKEYDAKKSSKLLVKTPKQRNSHKRTGKAYGAEEVNSD
ncbi:hypothetical protein A1F94_003955 [Pyrenophora tritici-repentis]|nr:hypothetical protein A1F94_003955 [Pyrenophora tritici-repentis]